MKPRDILLRKGLVALKNAELLAILIGSGVQGKSADSVADDLLQMTNHDLQAIGKLPPEGYALVDGIGIARGTVILAKMELGHRPTASGRLTRYKISSSCHVYHRFVDRLSDLTHEEFWVLLLKSSNEVLADLKISSGGLTGTVADP